MDAPKYPPTRLTERFVAQLPLSDVPYLVRDTKLTGFLVGVGKTSKSWKLQRDLWARGQGAKRAIKTIRHTLGRTDELTLDEARALAEPLLRTIKAGIDPFAPEPAAVAAQPALTVRWAFEQYVRDMKKLGRQPRTIKELEYRRDLYLSGVLDRPLAELRRGDCRALHDEITDRCGPSAANHALHDLKAAYNVALRIADEDTDLRANPINAVTFNKTTPRDVGILHEELADWWEETGKLKNPLRRIMHRLTLMSGMRSGEITATRREWIQLDKGAVVYPRLKNNKPWTLLLSDPMVALVKEALAAGDILFPGAEMLFPGLGQGGATTVWQEKRGPLKGRTGHILRHTYNTIGKSIGVDDDDRELLAGRQIKGMQGVYLHKAALVERLRGEQERISAEILRLAEPRPAAQAA